jgi:hypothetical protein
MKAQGFGNPFRLTCVEGGMPPNPLALRRPVARALRQTSTMRPCL